MNEGSSISLLLRRRYAFWTDAPKDIVERIASNMHLEFQCDAYWALPALPNGRVDPAAQPKRLLRLHHITGKGGGK